MCVRAHCASMLSSLPLCVCVCGCAFIQNFHCNFTRLLAHHLCIMQAVSVCAWLQEWLRLCIFHSHFFHVRLSSIVIHTNRHRLLFEWWCIKYQYFIASNGKIVKWTKFALHLFSLTFIVISPFTIAILFISPFYSVSIDFDLLCTAPLSYHPHTRLQSCNVLCSFIDDYDDDDDCAVWAVKFTSFVFSHNIHSYTHAYMRSFL